MARPDGRDEFSETLRAWRARVVDVTTVVLAVAGLPAVLSSLLDVRSSPAFAFWGIIYGIAYLFALTLALLRRLDTRVRGWGMLLLGYGLGTAALSVSLTASGRLYLFFLPVAALVFLGMRAGWIAAGVSVLTFVSFALRAYYQDPGSFHVWVSAGGTFVMLLVGALVLQQNFYRFLVRTLSELVGANERLEEYSRTLEERVARRTEELSKANAQLQLYANHLEAQNAELDAFAHTVAHDLKNPLSSLVGVSSMFETLREDVSPEQEERWLASITRNSRRMSNIVDELLLLASVRKMEEVKTAPIAMEEPVSEALQRLEMLVAEHDAEVLLPESWPTACGYAPWVAEVWTNYVSNALKYGGRPPRVELGATARDGWVRFWVRDNGPGLTEEECARLFAEFTRLHQVRAEGHGLGLSIVQRIVAKLGGEVGVESEPGHGSTFWFSLPRA
jgi:signal transduction histidine kinase